MTSLTGIVVLIGGTNNWKLHYRSLPGGYGRFYSADLWEETILQLLSLPPFSKQRSKPKRWRKWNWAPCRCPFHLKATSGRFLAMSKTRCTYGLLHSDSFVFLLAVLAYFALQGKFLDGSLCSSLHEHKCIKRSFSTEWIQANDEVATPIFLWRGHRNEWSNTLQIAVFSINGAQKKIF